MEIEVLAEGENIKQATEKTINRIHYLTAYHIISTKIHPKKEIKNGNMQNM